jgi:hypothetical protein
VRRAGAAAGALLAAFVWIAPPAQTGHDNTPPQTRITQGPGARTADRTPTFSFTANEANARFLCKVDAAGFGACTSPKTLGKLTRGRHGFYVKALDPFSNVDATAAAYSFKVVKK